MGKQWLLLGLAVLLGGCATAPPEAPPRYFLMLVLSETDGSIVREVAPPKR